jgi:hypothetical protein
MVLHAENFLSFSGPPTSPFLPRLPSPYMGSNLPPPHTSWRGYDLEFESAFGVVAGQVVGSPSMSHLFVVTGVTGAGVSAFTILLGHRFHTAGVFPGGIGAWPSITPTLPSSCSPIVVAFSPSSTHPNNSAVLAFGCAPAYSLARVGSVRGRH